MDEEMLQATAEPQPQVITGKTEAAPQTRLERLEARMAAVKKQIAEERKKEAQKQRRERSHRLIRCGGLVEMILGENVDPGTLAGLLAVSKEAFLAQNGEAQAWKRRGDAIIAEREAARRAELIRRKGGDPQDARVTQPT